MATGRAPGQMPAAEQDGVTVKLLRHIAVVIIVTVVACVLAELALVLGGAGHGSLVPFLLSSSAFGLFEVGFALKAIPLWWALEAIAIRWRWAFIAWQLCHYGGVLYVMFRYADILYLSRLCQVPDYTLYFFGLFILGQALLWYEWLRIRRLSGSNGEKKKPVKEIIAAVRK